MVIKMVGLTWFYNCYDKREDNYLDMNIKYFNPRIKYENIEHKKYI